MIIVLGGALGAGRKQKMTTIAANHANSYKNIEKKKHSKNWILSIYMSQKIQRF